MDRKWSIRSIDYWISAPTGLAAGRRFAAIMFQETFGEESQQYMAGQRLTISPDFRARTRSSRSSSAR